MYAEVGDDDKLNPNRVAEIWYALSSASFTAWNGNQTKWYLCLLIAALGPAAVGLHRYWTQICVCEPSQCAARMRPAAEDTVTIKQDLFQECISEAPTDRQNSTKSIALPAMKTRFRHRTP